MYFLGDCGNQGDDIGGPCTAGEYDDGSLPSISDGHNEVENIILPNSSTTLENDHNYSIKEVASKYLLKIKEESQLSQKAVASISSSTSCLLHRTVSSLKRKLEEVHQAADIDCSSLPGFEDAFKEVHDAIATLRNPSITMETDLPFVAI